MKLVKAPKRLVAPVATRWAALLQLSLAGFLVVASAILFVWMGVAHDSSLIEDNPDGADRALLIRQVAIVATLILIPWFLVGGIGLFRYRKWGRTWSIVAGVISIVSVVGVGHGVAIFILVGKGAGKIT